MLVLRPGGPERRNERAKRGDDVADRLFRGRAGKALLFGLALGLALGLKHGLTRPIVALPAPCVLRPEGGGGFLQKIRDDRAILGRAIALPVMMLAAIVVKKMKMHGFLSFRLRWWNTGH